MVLAFAVLTSPAAAAPGDVVADRVLGQGGSFLAQACNNGGVSATSLCTPDGVAVDSNGNVYVAELNNNRVLEYDNPLGSCGTCDMIADRVFGQGGSFTSSACNLGGITASSLCQAADVAVDSSDNVYVVDFGNNRVLEYLNPIGTDTIADRVFGQGGSFTSGTFTTSPTANTLTNPISVAVDATDHVYIGDRGMHRVLEYDPPNSNTTANRVFGQFGSFITGTFNNGGPSADSLGDFNGIGVDAAGNLYVADSNNARALEYDTPISTDTTADIVFGQFGSYSSTTPDNGGVTADSLETPTDIGADAAGNVYITDTGTERTLEYDNPVGLGTSADVVYGQGGSFTSFGNNNGGLSASSQADPWAIAFDHDCNLFIADYGNNRALEYDQPPHACANAGTATPTSTLCPVSACTATPTITDTPTITPTPTGCIPNPVQGCPTPTPTCSTAPCSSPTATPTCNASTGAICATATPCISPTGAVCTPTATSTPTSTPTCTPSSGVPCPTPTVTPCVPASGAVCTPTATSTSTPTVAPVLCGGLVATIVGTNGTDLILGTAGNDIIAGLSGNDVIIGMGGNDIICGGPGDDVIYGNAGADRLFGDTGNDVIFGGAGTDKMDGGPGFDFCDGGPPAFGDVQVNCELVTGVP
jgi:Ca2+-binding RTX toxin-like protein